MRACAGCPTTSSSSLTRLRTSPRGASGSCVVIASAICHPIRLHRVERVQRALEHDRQLGPAHGAQPAGDSVSTFSPSSSTSPVTAVPGGSSRRSAPATVDLPQPGLAGDPERLAAIELESTPANGRDIAAARLVRDAEIAHRRGEECVTMRRPRSRGSSTSSSAWPTSVNASTTSTIPRPGGR